MKVRDITVKFTVIGPVDWLELSSALGLERSWPDSVIGIEHTSTSPLREPDETESASLPEEQE